MSSPEIEVKTEQVTQTVQSEPVTVETSDWKSSLAEDLRSSDSLKDFKDINGLAKSYISAQQMIGNSIRIPGPDASDEAKAEFYNKLQSVPGVTRLPNPEDKASMDQFYNSLGRPESADKYNLKFAEGMVVDEAAVSNFKQIAHSIGLTNEQANKLAEFEAARYKAYEENIINSRSEAENLLKSEWGNDYTARLQGAKEVINQYKSKYPEAIEELVQGPAGNNPAFLSMLSELYGAMKESGSLVPTEQSVSYGMTPAEAKAQIQEVMNNRSHAYHRDGDPGHAAAVEKMAKLFAAAYPDEE